MTRPLTKRRQGRPRSFHVEKALDAAVRVFWRKGYDATSLEDLTAAMGIERPSLYAAFGDKERLFRSALDRYTELNMQFIQPALAEKRVRGFVERLLLGAAAFLTSRSNPRGCLTVQGALACAESSEPVRQELIGRRRQIQVLIRDRFRRAKKEKDLSASADPEDLARYFATVIQGMAVQASAGASRAQLQRVAVAALHALPRRRRPPTAPVR